MQNCPKCGGNNFLVVEWESYKGEIVEGKLLYSALKGNGIESVFCNDCGVDITDTEGLELEYVG